MATDTDTRGWEVVDKTPSECGVGELIPVQILLLGLRFVISCRGQSDMVDNVLNGNSIAGFVLRLLPRWQYARATY